VPDRVFLDANVLFSAAYSRSSELRRLWALEDVVLLSSAYAVTEAVRNVPPTLRDDLNFLVGFTIIVDTPTPEELPIPPGLDVPPKDAPIFRAAIGAAASHLLTGDKRHFGPYFGQRFAGVLIISPRAYLESRE
jgi:uncharacterized protein